MVHGQVVEISAAETNGDACHALLRNCGSNAPLQLHHDIQDQVEGKSFDHITDCFTPVCTPGEPVHLYFAGCPHNSGSSADEESAKSHAEALCSMIADFMPQCFIVENLVDSRFSEIFRTRAVGEQYEWFALPMNCHPLPTLRSRVYTIGAKVGVNLGPNGFQGMKRNLYELVAKIAAMPLHHFEAFLQGTEDRVREPMRRWLDAEAEAKYTSCFKEAIGRAMDCKAIPKDYKMLLKHPDSRVSSRCPDLEPWISAQIDAYELVIAYLLKGSEMTEEQKGKLHIVADVGQTCGRGKIALFGDLPAVASSSRWFSFKFHRFLSTTEMASCMGFPHSKKKAASVPVPAAEENMASSHPTMLALMDKWTATSFQEWLKQQPMEPQAFGGLQAFDEQGFVEAMHSGGEYNCTVHASSILPSTLTHSHLVPGMSAVQRVMDNLWCRESASFHGLTWQEITYIGAWSKEEAPAMGSLQPLSQDVQRLGFWMRLLQAHEEGWASELALALRTMKVCFVFVATAEKLESKKWELSAKQDTLAETAILRGWKRVLGIVHLKSQMVSRWLAKEKVIVSKEQIGAMVLVRRRVGEADLDSFMTEMEEQHGVDHLLSKYGTIEKLCQLTNVKSDAKLSNALLAYAMHDIRERLKNFVLSNSETKQGVLASAKGSLLSRRILFYLISKLRLARSEIKACPEDLGLATNLRSAAGFFSNFLSHKAYHDSGLTTLASDKTWLSQLLPYQRDSLQSLRLLLEPSPAMCKLLEDTVEKNQHISAEEVLQQPRWDSELSLQKLLIAKESWPQNVISPWQDLDALHPAPVVEAPPVQKLADEKKVDEEAQAKDANQSAETAAEIESDDKMVCHEQDIQAMPCEIVEAQKAELTVSEIMQEVIHDLVLPTWLLDIFKKVTPEVLKTMIESATSRLGLISLECCADAWVHFEVMENTSLPKMIQKYLAQDGSKLIIMDGKHLGHGRQGHSPGVPLPFMRAVLGSVLEIADEEAVHFKGDNILLVTDGRNNKCEAQLKKELKLGTKKARNICKRKGILQIRCLYHLREFSSSGHLAIKSKKVLHAQLAEPLENWMVLRGKTCAIPAIPRKHVDMGESSSRSISNLSLKSKEECDLCLVMPNVMESIYSTCCQIFDSTGGKQAEEKEEKVTSDTDEAASGESDKEMDPVQDPGMPCYLFPMGNSEAASREMLNLFGGKDKQKRQCLDISPGSGSLAWACARDEYRYTGLVASAQHGRVLRSSLIALILKEMVLGRKDGGFCNRRFLSKSRSLGSTIDEEQHRMPSNQPLVQQTLFNVIKEQAPASEAPQPLNSGATPPPITDVKPRHSGSKEDDSFSD
ncbi:unnamed protein product [Symbiodinium sp. CCMP2592]|nr:unnamed protein product [Symbiodinium sp. CCMP2592]